MISELSICFCNNPLCYHISLTSVHRFDSKPLPFCPCQGRRLEKNQFIFYRRISQMPRFVSASIDLKTCPSLICNASVEFQMKIRKISRRRPRSPKYPGVGHFTLSFCRERVRNVQRLIMHVHSHCSAH